MATTDAIRELREATGAGVMDCKRALDAAGGDRKQAEEILRQQGIALAEKTRGREAAQGLVESYIHGGGRIGVLVEINCETDFVARSDEFRQLVKDIAMQVAAMSPKYIGTETDLPADVQHEVEVLLKQPFIRDQSRTIQDRVTETIGKLRENIVVRRFARFELGS
ncbi:MAG: elongation factor Ts [Chloroflexi bacterium]|nr:elongation factor Ts [Chloroflexota bacterium]